MSEMMWQRSDEWVGTEIDDRYVMVSIETGKYVSLNPTANAIWQALEEPLTVSAICEKLCAEFTIAPDACATSVATTLETMREMQLASAT